jgi:hypothetical protein
MSNYDSLETHIKFLADNNITSPELYEWLAPIDKTRLNNLIVRLERVEALVFSSNPRGKKKKQFEGQKSRAKGRLYESIIYTLFKDIKAFETWRNVSTETNEIDILIIFGPMAAFTTPIRHWGTHCICECKNYAGGVKGDWLNKLRSVLQTHNATVGILFSKNGLASRSSLRTTIQIFAGQQPSRVLLCLDWNDLKACVNGQNFLSILNHRYVELVANLNNLLLVTG